ncbi:MAG TPA: ChaN family lipoprotein [Polyangiaceae bacterium]
MSLWGALALSAPACAPSAPPKMVGASDAPVEAPDRAPEPEQHPPSAPVPDDVVERAALPFHALRAANRVSLDQHEFFDELATNDVVCVAEHHDNPHHHWAQLFVIQELARRSKSSGRELGVGFEMFEARFQDTLTHYASGKLDTEALLQSTDYEARWGYPFQYYEPQIVHAVDQGSALVALNASREQVKTVAHGGFSALSDRELRLLGAYDLEDAEHRAQFDKLMQGHPQSGSVDQMYAAQVLWDESMAQNAASWLSERFPARQLVILAGMAHCHRSAIPSRLQRRFAAKVVSVQPLVLSDDDESADLTSQLAGYDYGFVMTPNP